MKKSLVIVACLGLGLSVAACGSHPNGKGAAPTSQNGGQNGDGSAGGPGGPGGGPGGSGKVAAVTGSTAQVQGQGGQVAVTWTAKTRFTQQVIAKASDLKVGDCVVAMPAMGGATSGSTDTSKVTAASVRISTPVSGSCTSGFRPDGGLRTDRSAPPQGGPSDAPSGAPSVQQRRGGFGAFGKVTAVSGSGFTVESARPAASSSASSSGSATTVTVTTSSDTTWTRSAMAAAKDVKVGTCVASLGKADSTGAITAQSITVSQPVNGQCAVMFGRPGGGQVQKS